MQPVPRPQPPGAARIFQLGVGPLGHDAAGRRPEVAVAPGPHGALEVGRKRIVVTPFGFRAHIDVSASARHPTRRAGHQPRAGLEDVDDRVATLVGVGTVEHEEVREAPDGHTQVGAGVGTPALVQPLPSDPDDVDARQIARRLESGGQHDRVDIDHLPGCGDHRRLGDSRDGIGDQLNVAFLQRPVILVTQQHPLAAKRIVRRQRVAQPAISHGALQKRRRDMRARGDHRVVGKRRGVVVLEFPDLPTRAARRQGVALKVRQFGCAVGPVVLGYHPWRRPLEHRHAFGDLREFRDNLHPAGTRPDHRHLLARQLNAVIPMRGVHERAAEVRQTLDFGKLWRSEQSGSADDDIGGQRGGLPGTV